MANNDVTVKDNAATPLSFFPETTDLGNSIRRPMYGKADGADLALGSKSDAPLPLPTVVGGGSLIAVVKGLWTSLLGLLTVDTVVRSTSVSRSGTITAGGTAQQLAPVNAARRGLVIQNQSSGDLFMNGLAAATLDGNSLKVPAGFTYETPPHHAGTGAVSVIGATTGQAFYAREF